jgi:acetyl-CoA carboxylase biotin carboxyl carrier protein
MQTRELKRLLDVLKDTDVSEMTLETGEYKLTVKRGSVATVAHVPAVQYAVPAAAAGATGRHPGGERAPRRRRSPHRRHLLRRAVA